VSLETPVAVEAAPPSHRVAAAVGVLGEVLITLGALLGLFVAWQLLWTDVVAGQRQSELIEQLGWDQPAGPTDPATDPTGDPTALPAEPVPAEHRDAAPVDAAPAEMTSFATLQVPRWGADYLRTISEGTNRTTVLDDLGIGHYEGTAMPGQIGNFSVAGHRTTYGKPFNRVEELQVGDPLVVRTRSTWYVYRVSSTEIVEPTALQVIAPVPGDPGAEPTVAMMTLTTCHPTYSARQRFIVHATLDHWTPVADGTPVELAGGA
jgi:sortase A